MALDVRLRVSYRLAAVLTLAHAGAMALLWPLPPALLAAAGAAIALSFVSAVRRTALLTSSKAIVALQLSEDDGVSFQTRQGVWHAARVLPSSFVMPELTILNLRCDGTGRVRHVVLMSDSASADVYRRLRVRLRWSRPAVP